MIDEIKFVVTPVYGRLEIDTRTELCGNAIVAYSRGIEYDEKGVISKIGEWSETSRLIIA